ncbi:MAG: AMP-binding protein [Desulfobacterales bacterium]|jgi:long-chain acyl-CoA synthetase|nr:AMP-binding protein [Desulfobacterales bacterium]
MTNKIWLRNYPDGIPAEINADLFISIPDLIEKLAIKFADKPAYHNLGHTISYAALERLSRDFAAFLQGMPNMAKGERVAIMAPNLLQYPVALFGILHAGMTVVNVNPLYTPRELEFQLKDSGAKAIVILENFANTLQQVLGKTRIEHVITTQLGDLLPIPKRWIVNLVIKRVKKMVPAWRIYGAIGFRSALARGAATPLKPVEVTHDDIAFLQYTGGTTGVPKGAVLTHRNVLANLEQTGVWVSLSFKEGTEIAIAPLPMYHIFCLTSTLSFMKWGSLIVLITNPRDLPALVKELGRWKFSVMTGVNTLFNRLLNTPGFDRLDFSALKVVVGGGAAVQKPVAERWQQVTGSYITEAYGLTETSPGVCANLLETPWNGTVGLPFSSTDVSIRDKNFNELPVWTGEGEIERHTGEICVRGPQVMRDYWNNPEETAKVMQDGWLKTGDIGYLNANGHVNLTDRKKDVILVSGFTVYPNEIESVIAAHPGVLECGVVGVPDEKSGEAVKAVILKKDPNLTKEAVIQHCKTQLTHYKLPRHVEFRDNLPKTPIGKVLRRALVDEKKR